MVTGPAVMDDPTILRATSRALAGVTGSSYVHPPNMRAYLRDYARVVPGAPTGNASSELVTGYRDAVEAFLLALEHAEGSSERLPAELRRLRIDLLGGPVRLDDHSQAVISTSLVRIGEPSARRGGAEVDTGAPAARRRPVRGRTAGAVAVAQSGPRGLRTRTSSSLGPTGEQDADNNEGDESVRDLLLCGQREISLVRADVRGGKVVLSGLVSARMAGRSVSILANYRPAKGSALRKLATVRPNSAGEFTARVAKPPSRLFKKARFQARVDRFRSVRLKLPQSLASSSVKLRGGQIVLRGKVKRSLLGKRNPVVVRRLVCSTYQTVGSAKPDRRGNYVVRFDAPALATTAGLYRAESRVLADREASAMSGSTRARSGSR